ncbi:acetate/propionate family kinase [Halopseudomonas pelagia]|uniref:Acetate kinase n=1 Tax=Halopseudomonas pelagia TaxID=553151 RepID=A0AA91Z7D4_9GAMM|nr:acetate kinase [Halopseudomonas pelagia]PCD00909.1 propionate/acetate kinase [Halopseudomonas pelagia]QFY58197.1 acetate kinase [Halopseudomonas pelagia]
MSDQLVLVINCGSSSIKFALRSELHSSALLSGLADRLGSNKATLTWQNADNRETLALADGEHATALAALLPLIERHASQPLSAVGHRVVHGGEHFTGAQIIDQQVLDAIRANAPLAPLHNPANLAGIEAAMRVFRQIPHMAIFDTAFHQSMPAHAYRYALPEALYTEHGIRRYGFHGTSHQYVTAQASKLAGLQPNRGAWLSAHLGNGCSSCAVLDGRSQDTSMGLTPLEGLVMGTRSGDVDPNLHAHLARTLNWDLPRIETMLNRESGLLGLSGLTNDMRQLEQARSEGHTGAALAIDVFCYRLARSLMGLAAALPRLDGLIFTGGIGENSALVRDKTLEHMTVLGLKLDTERNTSAPRGQACMINQVGSPAIMVIPTDEERQIADESVALIPH